MAVFAYIRFEYLSIPAIWKQADVYYWRDVWYSVCSTSGYLVLDCI